MPRYMVKVREVHIRPIAVEAPSKVAAWRLVDEGQGEQQGEMEFSHKLAMASWEVEDIPTPPMSSEDAVSQLQEVGVTAQVQFPNDNGAEFVLLTLPAVEELVKRLKNAGEW